MLKMQQLSPSMFALLSCSLPINPPSLPSSHAVHNYLVQTVPSNLQMPAPGLHLDFFF